MTTRETIEAAFRGDLPVEEAADAVAEAIALLDTGEARLAEPGPDGAWTMNGWLQEAILLHFRFALMAVIDTARSSTTTRSRSSSDFEAGRARRAARRRPLRRLSRAGAIVMPGYVNIGARVGAGRWSTRGRRSAACAQIGRDVHLSGGVGIGGVLEPPGARPVIVEDGAFIGSRCIVVEGVHGRARGGARRAAWCSPRRPPIIDVTGPEAVETAAACRRARSSSPARARRSSRPASTVPCALIIGHRTSRPTTRPRSTRRCGSSMSPSESDRTRAPLTGSVADVCHDLVATRSEYGDEERLADLVEARCAALGVVHERIRHCVVARTGGDGDPVALVGHLDTVPNWPDGGSTAPPSASSGAAPRT